MWPFSTPYPERRPEEVDGAEFDYIVVGGGAAGCVLASRLSEDANVSVLLLERGRVRDSFLSRIPLISQGMEYEWLQAVIDRLSAPVRAVGGTRLRLWGAEGMGGSTRINAMLVTRGFPATQTEWVEDLGLDQWSWDKVEPYYRKMEKCVSHPGKSFHGYDGPLEHRQVPPAFSFYTYLEKAARQMGLPVEDDINDPSAAAQAYYSLDQAVDGRGRRISSYRAYLNKQIALQRQKHLTVCTGAVASKLEIDATKSKVTGVYIMAASSKKRPRKTYLARAKREVILCNGALRSPQLLMLSGIGPRKHLESQGITCVRDLPKVGDEFTDHVAFPVMMKLPQHDTLHQIFNVFAAIWQFILYLVLGKGILSLGSTQSTIYLRTSALDKDSMTVRARDKDGHDAMDQTSTRNIPDAEIMTIPVDSLTYSADYVGHPFGALYVNLARPFSRGSLELKSTDPFEHPLINYPMLTDERDWRTMRLAVRFTMRYAEEFRAAGYPHPAPLLFAPGMDLGVLDRFLQSHATADWDANDDDESVSKKKRSAVKKLRTSDLPLEPVPAGKWRDISDEEIDEYARRVCKACLHYAGTCRMARDAKDGVVDQELKVFGIRGLRVADASVFPRIPTAHTMVPTMMIAERCADFLKEEWKDAN